MAKKEPLGWGDLAARAGATSTPEGKLGWADITRPYDVPEPVVEPEPAAPIERSTSEYITDPLAKLASGVIGAGEAAVGAADLLTGGRAGQFMEESLGYRPEEAKAFIRDEFMSKAQREADAKVAAAKGFAGTVETMLDNPSNIVGAAVESLPLMLGGAGVARGILARAGGALSPVVAGAIGEGAVATGAAAEAFRQKAVGGELGGKEYLASLGTGVGTGVFGFVGGKLAQKFGFGDIDTMLAQGGANVAGLGKTTATDFAKQVFKAGVSEGAFEEMPQSWQEQMWQNYAEGKPIMDGVAEAGAQGLVVGAAMGVAGGGYNAAKAPSEQREAFKDYVISSAVQGIKPSTEEFLKNANDPAWVAKNRMVAGLQQNLAIAEGVLIEDPTNQTAIDKRDSAKAILTAALTTPDQRDILMQGVNKQSVEEIRGAKDVDGALSAFSKWQDASSTMRTGAMGADIIAGPDVNGGATPAVEPVVAPATAAVGAPPLEAQINEPNAAALAAAPTVVPGSTPAPAATATPTPAPAATATPTPAPAAPATTASLPKLPQELAGAKPRAGFGSKQFIPEFESDLDKAAYIISQGKKSKADAAYLKFVMDNTDLDEDGARNYGRGVRAQIKALTAAAQPGDTIRIPATPIENLRKTPAPTATVETNHEPKVEPAPAPAPAPTAEVTPIPHIARIRAARDKGIPVGTEVAAVLDLFNDDGTMNGDWKKSADTIRRLREMNRVPYTIAGPAAGITQDEWDAFRTTVATRTTGSNVAKLGAMVTAKKKPTIEQMLDTIEMSATTNPHFRKLAGALKKFAKGNPYLQMKYHALPKPSREPGYGGRVESYLESGQIIDIENNPDVADDQTTLHETIHAMTLSWLNQAWSEWQRGGKIDPLLDELLEMHSAALVAWAKQNPGKSPPYGIQTKDGRTDAAEFLSEAFANPEFQSFLMSVPATRNQSLWDKLVSWVRDLLGDPDVDLNMLGQALAATEKAIKKSTKAAKEIHGEPAGPTSTDVAEDAEADSDPDEARTRDALTRITDDIFQRMLDEGGDGTLLDSFLSTVEKLSGFDYDRLQGMRTSGRSALARDLAGLIADRLEVGYDDSFDVINDRLNELEMEDAQGSMMSALGLDEDDFPTYTPDGESGLDVQDDAAGVADTLPQYELDMRAALDELVAAGRERIALAQRTIPSSESNLQYMATTSVSPNSPQNRLARAMRAFPNIEDARVAADTYLTDLLNSDIVAAADQDRQSRRSDPEPAYVPGSRKIEFNFVDRLGKAYRDGVLPKLAQFWQNVMAADDQFTLKVDTSGIFPADHKGGVTDTQLTQLGKAYNAALYEKAKQWAKANGQPEPKPAEAMILRSLKHDENEFGKGIIRLTLTGRGTGRNGDNPYLRSTTDATSATMDYDTSSKKNEIHAMDLDGYNGTSDLVYRIFADVAKASGFRVPTAETLMSNNNVRRPWQTVAAALRTKNPDVLSPVSGERKPIYGIPENLWNRLNDDERTGALIMRHMHNMLVSRPANADQWGRQVISAAMPLDNLVPTKNGKGFEAKFEPKGNGGLSKGAKIEMKDLPRVIRNVGAMGQGKRQGVGPTSLAFALMSQHVLDQIEAGIEPDMTKAATTMGRKAEGWFFEKSDAQERQLREEIEALQSMIDNDKLTPEEREYAREALMSLQADPIDAQINELLNEHRDPKTSNGRRGEINRKIAALRMEQDAKRETVVANVTAATRQGAEQAIANDQIVTPVRMEGYHYSHQPRTELSPQKYGTGYKGEERNRVFQSDDPRLRNRVYFYADAGNGVRPESGVGGVAHHAYLGGIYPAHDATAIQQTVPNTLTGDDWLTAFESAVLDAGYRGYSANFGQQLAVVMFGDESIPVQQTSDVPGPTAAGTPAAGETLINVGLDVGADERTEKLTPAQVRKEIEKVGGKIATSKVIPVTYEQGGETVTEDTLVVRLVEPMNASQMDRLAEATKQVAIGQWTEGVGGKLHGAQAWTWGGFKPNFFYGLDGKPVSARGGDIAVSNEESGVEFSPEQQQAITHAPVAPAYPNEVKVVARSAQAPLTRALERFREKYQDQNVTMGRVIRALGRVGDAAMDVIDAIDRSKGLIQSNLEKLVKEPLAKIENDLFRAGVKDPMAKLENYLKMRHVEEANIHGAKVNPYNASTDKGFNLTNRPASGITTADAQAELARIMASPDFPALQQAARTYDAMIHALQDYAVERGLESADTIRAWRATFQNYAPFYRDLGLEDSFSTGSQGYSTRSGVSRRFMGSAAEIRPILPSVRILGERIVNRGETARVAQSLLALAKNNTPMFMAPDGTWKPMWKIDTFPNIRTVKAVNVYQFKDINGNFVKNSAGVPVEFYRRADAESYLVTNTNQQGGPKSMVELGVQERVVTTQKPDYISQDNVVIAPMSGENVAIVFNDQSEDAVAMYRNLKNLDTENLSKSMVPFQIASRWIVATATGYNPVFAPFNFTRDVQSVAANINTDKIPGWKASDTAQVVKESLENIIPLFKHLHAQFRNLHSNTPRMAPPAKGTPPWWMEFAKESGGLTGIMDSTRGFDEAQSEINELFGLERAAKRAPVAGRTTEDWGTKLNEKLAGTREWFDATLEGESKDQAGKLLGYIAKSVGNLNQAFELATRTAAFKAAYEKYMAVPGTTSEEAAKQAAIVSKNVSVNFNRRGQNTTFWGALFPFFNAAVQGSARLAQTIFERKAVTNPDGSVSDTSEITPFGWKVLSVLPALGILQAALLAGYDDDEIPEADKDRNFIIPLDIPLGDGKFAKIPLPLGFNVPFNIGREVADMGMAVTGKDNRSFAKHAGSMLGQFGAFNPLGGAGNLAQTVSPALLDPFLALYQNEDAFGRTIAKEDMDKTKPTPGYTRYKEGATGLAKDAAYAINYMSGGGKYGIGAFSPTPDQIDYAVGQITGGVGREVAKTIQSTRHAFDKATGAPTEELPWYRVPVAGRLYGDLNEPASVKSMIYSDREQIAKLDYERDQAIKAKDKAAAAKIVAEHPEVNFMPRIDAALREEAQLRKQRIAAREAGNIEKVNEITERINQKMLRLRDEIDRVKSGQKR